MSTARYLTSIRSFEAPQADTALTEPYADLLLADMAYLTPEALKRLGSQTELFEAVSLPAPYDVTMWLADGAVQLDLKSATEETRTCLAPMRLLRDAIEAYVKTEQRCFDLRNVSADEANQRIGERQEARRKGGYALMMAFRQEGLSMDPSTAEAIFGVVALTREQIIDRHATRHAPATSQMRQ